jgi:hypothetical protein
VVAPAFARVDVQISPATQTVSPGAEFDVQFNVTNSTPLFNAFHFLVQFDPQALTPIKTSPSSQYLGPLMTASCSNFFNWYHLGASADTIDVSMLCAGVSAWGPGVVYHIHFVASATPQVTSLTVAPDANFANGGIYLDSVVVHGAAIGIGMTPPPLAVPPSPTGALLLSASPNPAHGDVALDFGRPLVTGGVLAIHDVQGRELRRYELAPGARGATWDGRDATGERVRPGVYLAALRTGAERRVLRLAQVR